MQVTITLKDKAASKVNKWLKAGVEKKTEGFKTIEGGEEGHLTYIANDNSVLQLLGTSLVFAGARETFLEIMKGIGIEGNKAFYAAVDTYEYQQTKAKFIRPWQLLTPEKKAEMEEKEAVRNFYKNLNSSLYPEEVKAVIKDEKDFEKKTHIYAMLTGLTDFDKTMKEIKSVKSLSPRNQENRIKWLNANHPGWEILKPIAFKVKLKEEPKRKARAAVVEEAPKAKKKK